ncbi:probable disease resistance protein At4g27220 [Rosa rugosa]|uniref:probable disease resistance protein At4g27220 n=1 Tax=Rosa rugosa TaxID=74645 RepID=UPI002B4167B5|nr:probable disease resistance protein At4g27220 [Rosa rugosa]
MDEVMQSLKDDEVSAIAIHGMGGVGKTTMVKHIAAQARNDEIFYKMIMTVEAQSPDLTKIQGELADLLGVKFGKETKIGRAVRLNKEIMIRNKILIILDDLWGTIGLSIIGIPTFKELQNRKSFDSINSNDVARKVARECSGLPIALIVVARALGDKDLVEWEKALRRLEKSQIANLDEKGDNSKSCFLLCCLFPEDHGIRIENLFKYAIGKGLFGDADTIETRGPVDSVVKYLKDSSLLLDSEEVGCERMHDVIRDTTTKIALSEDGHGFLVKQPWFRGNTRRLLCSLTNGNLKATGQVGMSKTPNFITK